MGGLPLEGQPVADGALQMTVDIEEPRSMEQRWKDHGRAVVGDLLGNPPEWQERALCSQSDPDAFFPEKGGSTREAKRVCGLCEVKDECLRYAMTHEERFGIWGGLSERERRKLKRRAI